MNLLTAVLSDLKTELVLYCKSEEAAPRLVSSGAVRLGNLEMFENCTAVKRAVLALELQCHVNVEEW